MRKTTLVIFLCYTNRYINQTLNHEGVQGHGREASCFLYLGITVGKLSDSHLGETVSCSQGTGEQVRHSVALDTVAISHSPTGVEPQPLAMQPVSRKGYKDSRFISYHESIDVILVLATLELLKGEVSWYEACVQDPVRNCLRFQCYHTTWSSTQKKCLAWQRYENIKR
jgi:hypothetical protein